MQVRVATRTHLGLAACVVAATFLGGCLVDPQRAQLTALLDRLSDARAAFGQPATLDSGCLIVGEVQTRLLGGPGLSERGHAYEPIHDAAAALQAVCGQGTMLREATADTVASHAARTRWQAGLERELGVACEHLRVAAHTLDRPLPC